MFPVIVAAIGRNREMSRNGKIPWRSAADLKWFQQKCRDYGQVICGWNTYKAMGFQPPTDWVRMSVLTSVDMTNQLAANAEYHQSYEAMQRDLFAGVMNDEEFVIAGGQAIYDHFIPHANIMYISEVAYDAPEGTAEEHAYFPAFDETLFTKRLHHTLDDGTPVYVYTRIIPITEDENFYRGLIDDDDDWDDYDDSDDDWEDD